MSSCITDEADLELRDVSRLEINVFHLKEPHCIYTTTAYSYSHILSSLGDLLIQSHDHTKALKVLMYLVKGGKRCFAIQSGLGVSSLAIRVH